MPLLVRSHLSTEDVSLLEGYQEQFAEDVRAGGVVAVIEKMRRHNAK